MDEKYWDERYSGTELIWTAQANRFVVQECALLAPGSALDLACGEGRNAVWLATRGWSVTGVDWSEVGLGKARQLADSAGVSAAWIHADVLGWQPDRLYDLVVIAYFQLAERQAVLELAGRATIPGGSLLVVAHDLRNLTEGVGGPQRPEVLWTPEEVALPGFSAARRETAVRPTETGDALDTVVRLVREPRP